MRQGLSNADRSRTERWWMKVFAVAIAFAPVVNAADEADARKEKRLYQIYRNYYAQPTSSEKWSEALSRSKDQTYAIQKGDTLWGISETFFGNPNFWPKIWSLNSDIYNPHEIVPSGIVSFKSGSATEPPSLAVGDAPVAPPGAEAVVDPAAPVADAAPPESVIGQYIDLDLSQIKIPPPLNGKGSPRAIPNSVPGYVFYRDPSKTAVVEVTQITRAPVDNIPLAVNDFVSDNEIQGPGEVVGTEFGFTTAGEGQEMLIRASGLTSGARVMSVRRLGFVKGQKKAIAYAVGGMLEVLASVNSSESLYRARVVKSVNHVAVGDILVSEELPTTIPNMRGTMSPVTAQIIGGEYSTERRIFGPLNVVYLNAGANQGLAVGTHIPVYRNPGSRNANLLIRENAAEIGELQVVRVSGGVATAVVIRSLEDIRVGDVTSPAMNQTQ